MNDTANSRRLTWMICAFAISLMGGTRLHSQGDSPKGCILIQQMKPSVVKADDSGITTEPILLTINATGTPDDLKNGEIVYLEDGLEKRAIPIGDLRPGVQILTISPGVHMNSSDELFDMEILGSTHTDAYVGGIPLNSRNYVPPPSEPAKKEPSASASDNDEDSDQPIETIKPGVDRDEAESIRQFGAADIGLTSFDGNVRLTSGDEANQPPQTLTLHGTNFKDGMLVKFSTKKGGQPVEATSPLTHTNILATLKKPSWYTPDNPSALMSATVSVPAAITHDVESAFLVRAAHAATADTCK